jgi:hypothetical protein
MNFGKISAVFFILACLSFMVLYKFSYIFPSKSFDGYLLLILIVFGPPIALVFGIIGIIFDKNKTIALLSSVLSAIPSYFFVLDIIGRFKNHGW